MAKAHPVQIGETLFPRKGDALAYLRDMLNRYSLNERVSDADAVFLRDALDNHPEAETKVGVGVDYFSVRLADYGTRCFWVVRLDGTEERFSYKSCV